MLCLLLIVGDPSFIEDFVSVILFAPDTFDSVFKSNYRETENPSLALQ